jgi:hypothetical protein
MAEQLAEERDDLSTSDVAHVEIEVQAKTAATRGHGERVNPKIYLLEATHAALLNPGTALLPYALPAGRPGPSASTPAAVGKGGCLPLSCLRAVTD